jgi:hypothetical protein
MRFASRSLPSDPDPEPEACAPAAASSASVPAAPAAPVRGKLYAFAEFIFVGLVELLEIGKDIRVAGKAGKAWVSGGRTTASAPAPATPNRPLRSALLSMPRSFMRNRHRVEFHRRGQRKGSYFARIPAKWNHFAEKDSRQVSTLEHRQSPQLWRDLLLASIRRLMGDADLRRLGLG